VASERLAAESDAPAGALLFEVRELPDKKLKVYTSYVAQSPEQMRGATPLVGDVVPQRTALRLPGCSSTQPGFPCTIEEFAGRGAQLPRSGLRE
jgi:hypothetical protein